MSVNRKSASSNPAQEVKGDQSFSDFGVGNSGGAFGGRNTPFLSTGGEGSLTQWVHCEFVVSFETIRPVITQQVCGEFF